MVCLGEQEKSVETESETEVVPNFPEKSNSPGNSSAAASLFAAANAASPTGKYSITVTLFHDDF